MYRKLHNQLFTILFLLIGGQILNAQTSLEINVIGEPIVGETVTIEVTATHAAGINLLRLIKDKDYSNIAIMACNGSTTCTMQIETSLDYLGTIIFDAELWGEPYSYVTGTSLAVSFTCGTEYCDPDPEINEFITWMREVGYDECVIERYYSYAEVPELRAAIKTIARKRRIGYNQTDTVIFYDIVPTDSQATFIGMDIGEAPICVPNTVSPEFCPSPTSADYTFLENHWRTIFGIDFTFQYERIELSYVNTFGPPIFNASTELWQFNIPNSFYTDVLEPNNIAHFAVQTWNGQPVRDIDGGRSSAQLFSEPTTLLKFGIYTHEWGHAQGLPHTFVNINGVRTFFSPDGIMSNTYTSNTNIFDPLDPLERYVFEPVDDYVDQSTFADNYSQAIVATSQFNNVCENIDPAVTAFTLDSSTNDTYTFKATLNNLGTLNASFIKISLSEENATNPPFVERTYEVLEPNTSFDVLITVAKNLIPSNSVFIMVDPMDVILDEDETNNLLSIENILSVSETMTNQFTIYPNPVSGIINIEALNSIEYQTKLFSLEGKLIDIKIIINL